MAADDKSKRKGAGYLYKSYVVGDYKDLLESLRAEDTKDTRGREKPPVEAEQPSVVEAEQEEVFVEADELAAVAIATEEEKPPAKKEESLIVADELKAAIALVIEKEEAMAATEKSPAETKESPTEAEEETTVTAEEPSTEAEEETTVAAEEPSTEAEEETTVAAEEPSTEAEEETTVAAEEPSTEAEEEISVAAEEPSTEAEEEISVAAEEPPTEAAEEISVAAEEPPTETEEETLVAAEKLPTEEEAPVAEKESAVAAEEIAAAVVLSAEQADSPSEKAPPPKRRVNSPVKKSTSANKGAAPPTEESVAPGSFFHKDVLCFNLTMIFLLSAIATVLLYSPNMGSFSMFILISCMIFNMIASYNLGLQKGLIVAVIMTFAYGSYILYETMVTRTISEINFAYIAWLFFFPLGSLLSGQMSNAVSTYRWALENKKALEKFVTIDASTGFYNKQGFFRKMDEEFTRAKRYKTSFSVLLINIANFNELRIIYGEINSVNILKTVADIVTAQVRYSDIRSLIEENMLAVILTETNDEGAKIVIEKMHLALDRVTTEIDSVKKVIRIKPNIGIASIQEGDKDALEIYDRAKEEINYDRG